METEVRSRVVLIPCDTYEEETVYERLKEGVALLGGMEQFVKNGWAGKDYTHINYAGGRRVAWALFDALNAEACALHAEQRAAELRRQTEAAVPDSLQKARIERSLLPAAAPEPLKPPIR